MENLNKNFLKALYNDTSCDFIANNYYQFSKEELKDIILELLYAVHSSVLNSEEEILMECLTELQERWNY